MVAPRERRVINHDLNQTRATLQEAAEGFRPFALSVSSSYKAAGFEAVWGLIDFAAVSPEMRNALAANLVLLCTLGLQLLDTLQVAEGGTCEQAND